VRVLLRLDAERRTGAYPERARIEDSTFNDDARTPEISQDDIGETAPRTASETRNALRYTKLLLLPFVVVAEGCFCLDFPFSFGRRHTRAQSLVVQAR